MANLQALQKSCAVVHIISPQDINGGAVTGDYIHMKNYDSILFVCQAGALNANLTFTVTQCTQDADAGTDDKAITGNTATVTIGSCVALCYRARWAEATMPSAIT